MNAVMHEGWLTEGRGGLYTAVDDTGTAHVLRAKKKFRREHLTPLVGDRVLFTPGAGDEHGWVEQILPRLSVCFRPPVANVTLLAVVLASAPEPDWLLADKMLLWASMQGIRSCLILNKCDLSDAHWQEAQREYAACGIPLIRASAEAGEGLQELLAVLQGETVCFCGQSAVGKSTLLNALLGLRLPTGALSRIERGRHTTRHAQLIFREGFRVMDTPGFSLLDFDTPIEPNVITEHYPEYASLAARCRFRQCSHTGEPGCAVSEAVRAGYLPQARYERYRLLMKEAQTAWRERYD